MALNTRFRLGRKPVLVSADNVFEAVKKGQQVDREVDWEPRGIAPSPTRALPGSPEKISVLTMRAMLGYELWHPEDGPCLPDRSGRGRVRSQPRSIGDGIWKVIRAGLSYRVVTVSQST